MELRVEPVELGALIERAVEMSRPAIESVGIAQEDLDAIFDVFVQLDRSPERVTGGLGIGLTLLRRLVELHGGQVSAGSAGPAKGSRFALVLPRRHGHMRISNQAGTPA